MGKDYKKVFAAEELEYLERRMKEALERVGLLPDLTDEEDAAIHAAALSDPDNPPLREDAVLRPLYQVHPEFVAKMMRRRRTEP